MGSSLGAMLPEWQSHKRVRAARLVEINDQDQMSLEVPGDGDKPPIWVKPAANMFARYRPVPGDYYVVYDDGYAAISPKAAFEGGYTLVGAGA